MSIRVLHVINGLGTGGSERSLGEVLPGLAEHGIVPTVACFYPREEGVQDDLLARGCDVRFIDSERLAGRALALRRLIVGERIDLVHTTHFEADLAGRLAALRTGVPVISSLVSTPYVGARFSDPRVNRFKLAAVRAVDGWTGRRFAAHFHAVSNTVKAAAIRDTRFAASKITVIERGRDGKRLGTASPERRIRARVNLGLAAEHEVIVHVGRHEYAKGQRYLLDAVATLLPEHPRLVLLIAGRDGAVSEELRDRCQALHLGDHVRLLGHRDDVPEVLAAADVFAFPSLYEGLPGAVVEAMAMSLPIVGSRVDGVAEAVEEGGNALLCAPRSSSELAGRLDELLGAPAKLAAFGQRSRALFEERFTLDRCTRRMADLFRHVAGIEATDMQVGG